MPGYGQLTAGAARGYWRCSRLPDNQVARSYREGSLLAANFNALWCDALNFAAQERGPDYFAMQHADVEPQDYWLDELIAEMDAHGLDILGVAVPIKDTRGVTSLALARDDTNWRVHCRLTMTDLQRLPETFTSADIGHPLLLNTGLWVCRFDPAWARKVHFEINDRIVIDRTGKYIAECEPEDWQFSRLLHELGLKIGATRKIRLEHRGCASFSNQSVWGEPYDTPYVNRSPLDEPGAPFALPCVNGWLKFDEGRKLAELAAGKRVLEVGSYLGLSTVCLARTAEHVTSVDPHDGRGTEIPQATAGQFGANMVAHGVSDKVRSIVQTFADAVADGAIAPDEQFDLIHIDGDHARESVESDIALALPMLAPGGVLVFHDYGSEVDPGVAEVVDDLINRGGRLLSVTGTLAVVSPPAEVLSYLEV